MPACQKELGKVAELGLNDGWKRCREGPSVRGHNPVRGEKGGDGTGEMGKEGELSKGSLQ